MSHSRLHLFIAGERIYSENRESRAVVNPASGEELGKLPVATSEDLDKALRSAQEAFPVWRSMTAYERGSILRKAADILRSRAEEIGRLITLEEGIPKPYGIGEVLWTADIIDWCAEEGRRLYGRVIPSSVPGMTETALRQPIGVAIAFTPWNAPVLMPGRKIAEALAAGCTTIIKPAEETPASALEVIRAFDEAGVPEGVVNAVFGIPAEISSQLISSPISRKISFTGSVAVGRELGSIAGSYNKPITLELGGHAPVIVFDDTDISKVVENVAAIKLWNSGQLCGSPARILVQEKVYERFLDEYVRLMEQTVVGDGMEEGTQMGPLANERRIIAMEGFVEDAVSRGAIVKTGGCRPSGLTNGFYFSPTVITNLDTTSKIMNQEPFGPISAVMPFNTVDDAIMEANRLSFGLAAYAFTRSQATAQKLIDEVETGQLGINTFAVVTPEVPFGGVKDSGYGKEGGMEGVSAYLATKHIAYVPE